jgi:hypothetical protein
MMTWDKQFCSLALGLIVFDYYSAVATILLLMLQAVVMPLMISFLHIVEQRSLSRGIEPEQ